MTKYKRIDNNEAEYQKVNDKLKESPQARANIFSKLLFWWMNDIMSTGSKRSLEQSDLYPLLEGYKTRELAETLETTWHEEVTSHPPSRYPSRYRLFRSLMRMFPWTEYAFLLSCALVSGLCNVLQPVLLSLLLPVLIVGSYDEGYRWAYLYGAGICVSILVRVLANYQFQFGGAMMSMRWKAAVIGFLLKKVTQFNQHNMAQVTSGYVINLVAGDTQRFEVAVMEAVFLCQAVFEFTSVSLLTWYYIGPKGYSGILFMAALIILFAVLGCVTSKLRLKTGRETDRRISTMNAIIPGIRTVKMHAWELSFLERVQTIRKKEISYITKKFFVVALSGSLLYACQPIASCLSLATLWAFDVKLSVFSTFMIFSLLSSIRSTVASNIAQPSKYLSEFWASLNRMQALLDTDVLEPYDLLERSFCKETGQGKEAKKRDWFLSKLHSFNDAESPNRKHKDVSDDVVQQSWTKTHAVFVKDITCNWKNERSTKNVLSSISFSVEKGELVIVTGPVGSGKSSLLFALLGELPLSRGELKVHGTIAYVPQQPWIFSGTVQDNILFGKPLNKEKYKKVILACNMGRDIRKFPQGDLTVIGERGVLLSGGQRSRVGLARAVYADADVYLMDDPLSAVDAKVGKHIFEECICKALAEKTRIVITHRLQYLKSADHIIVMDQGEITGEGSHEKLCASGFEFDNLEETHPNEDKTVAVKKTPKIQRSLSTHSSDGDSAGFDMEEEDRFSGSVSFKSYWAYVRAGRSALSIAIIVIIFLAAQALLVLPDWWLLKLSDPSQDQNGVLKVYGALVAGSFTLGFVRVLLVVFALLNSSRHLHDDMLATILKAPVYFFDTNPVGRILNRFSGDMTCLDEAIPDALINAVQGVLFCFSGLILPSVINPWILIVVFPLLFIFVALAKYYLKSSVDIKRMESVNRSPILAHFSDSLDGLVTIKAYKMERSSLEKLYRFQDNHNQTWVMLMGTERWLSVHLDMLCVLFVTVVVFAALATQSGPGFAALSIVYALQLAVEATQFSVRMCARLQTLMTSTERIGAYTEIEPEAGYELEAKPPKNWPKQGSLQIKNLSLVYYSGGPEVLKSLTFDAKPKEKIGVAGRTGAGKSSLVSALLRMPEPTGQIIVDGVNVGSLNIQHARKAFSIIAQDPTLFSGHLRMNLDPFEKYSDNDIWQSLDDVGLKPVVKRLPKRLLAEVQEGGANFSVGERQLICLARGLLLGNKIIVLDEATANVDYRTDRLIQDTIRKSFRDCTVITIAHRLNTIMDYDKILVLSSGKVVEFDSPDALIKKDGGHFAQLYMSSCAGTGSGQEH